MTSRKGDNLIITGLPRSGTSFLCARINEFDNTVVINEPAEIFDATKGGNIEGLAAVFQQYRDDITQGKPVHNKIRDGKFIEDTRLEDNRSLHYHAIENDRFTLGIKNTLVFLAMLPEIAASSNFSKIIATIRHPYDCIGSWHNVDFPHIRDARPAYLKNYAGEQFSKELADLLQEDNLIKRSARLWALLASTLWRMKSKIHIARYEDLVAKPDKAYESMSKYLGKDKRGIDWPAVSRPVRRRDAFDEEQKSVIASICNKLAVTYGYNLN